MSKCNIDHTREDVLKKFQAQYEFMPEETREEVNQFLTKELNQETLNELFHLLKKYDLASEAERQERNEQLIEMVHNR